MWGCSSENKHAKDRSKHIDKERYTSRFNDCTIISICILTEFQKYENIIMLKIINRFNKQTFKTNGYNLSNSLNRANHSFSSKLYPVNPKQLENQLLHISQLRLFLMNNVIGQAIYFLSSTVKNRFLTRELGQKLIVQSAAQTELALTFLMMLWIS